MWIENCYCLKKIITKWQTQYFKVSISYMRILIEHSRSISFALQWINLIVSLVCVYVLVYLFLGAVWLSDRCDLLYFLCTIKAVRWFQFYRFINNFGWLWFRWLCASPSKSSWWSLDCVDISQFGLCRHIFSLSPWEHQSHKQPI